MAKVYNRENSSVFIKYTAACLNTYQDGPPVLLPDGYSLYMEFDGTGRNSGYFGLCYIKRWSDGGLRDVLFAHRGTKLTSMSDLWNDLEIAFNAAPSQCYDAYDFCRNCLASLSLVFHIEYNRLADSAEHTGHSLGAVIADVMVAKLLVDRVRIASWMSITFENPGSMQAIRSLIEKGWLLSDSLDLLKETCLVHQSHSVHLINTAKPQSTHRVFYITVNHEYDELQFHAFMPPPSRIPPGLTANLYYFSHSLHFHSIERLYNITCRPYDEWEVFDAWSIWPYGFMAGYDMYRTQYQDCFQQCMDGDYWQAYAEYLWNHFPSLHEEYRDSSEFYSAFCDVNLIHGYGCSDGQLTDVMHKSLSSPTLLVADQHLDPSETKSAAKDKGGGDVARLIAGLSSFHVVPPPGVTADKKPIVDDADDEISTAWWKCC